MGKISLSNPSARQPNTSPDSEAGRNQRKQPRPNQEIRAFRNAPQLANTPAPLPPSQPPLIKVEGPDDSEMTLSTFLDPAPSESHSAPLETTISQPEPGASSNDDKSTLDLAQNESESQPPHNSASKEPNSEPAPGKLLRQPSMTSSASSPELQTLREATSPPLTPIMPLNTPETPQDLPSVKLTDITAQQMDNDRNQYAQEYEEMRKKPWLFHKLTKAYSKNPVLTDAMKQLINAREAFDKAAVKDALVCVFGDQVTILQEVLSSERQDFKVFINHVPVATLKRHAPGSKEVTSDIDNTFSLVLHDIPEESLHEKQQIKDTLLKSSVLQDLLQKESDELKKGILDPTDFKIGDHLKNLMNGNCINALIRHGVQSVYQQEFGRPPGEVGDVEHYAEIRVNTTIKQPYLSGKKRNFDTELSGSMVFLVESTTQQTMDDNVNDLREKYEKVFDDPKKIETLIENRINQLEQSKAFLDKMKRKIKIRVDEALKQAIEAPTEQQLKNPILQDLIPLQKKAYQLHKFIQESKGSVSEGLKNDLLPLQNKIKNLTKQYRRSLEMKIKNELSVREHLKCGILKDQIDTNRKEALAIKANIDSLEEQKSRLEAEKSELTVNEFKAFSRNQADSPQNPEHAKKLSNIDRELSKIQKEIEEKSESYENLVVNDAKLKDQLLDSLLEYGYLINDGYMSLKAILFVVFGIQGDGANPLKAQQAIISTYQQLGMLFKHLDAQISENFHTNQNPEAAIAIAVMETAKYFAERMGPIIDGSSYNLNDSDEIEKLMRTPRDVSQEVFPFQPMKSASLFPDFVVSNENIKAVLPENTLSLLSEIRKLLGLSKKSRLFEKNQRSTNQFGRFQYHGFFEKLSGDWPEESMNQISKMIKMFPIESVGASDEDRKHPFLPKEHRQFLAWYKDTLLKIGNVIEVFAQKQKLTDIETHRNPKKSNRSESLSRPTSALKSSRSTGKLPPYPTSA